MFSITSITLPHSVLNLVGSSLPTFFIERGDSHATPERRAKMFKNKKATR